MTRLHYTGERAIPWNAGVGQQVMIPHIMRYAWACQFCWQKRVVDLGCGTGYGSFILSLVAREVIGIELDMGSLYYAEQHFQADNLRFSGYDLNDRPLPHADIYTAFEVLEHLDNPDALVRSLQAPLVWSIPVNNDSRFHKHIYSEHDIIGLMGAAEWYQSSTGQVMPRYIAPEWFEHTYILGVHSP